MGRCDGKIALVGGKLGKMRKGKFKMGLGGLIAKDLVDEGCKAVFIVDLDYEVTDACAKELGSDAIKPKDVDLLKERTFETEEYTNERGQKKTKVIWKDNPALDLVKDIVGEYGTLDILVTNFDEYKKNKITKQTDEEYEEMRDKNLVPVFHLLAAVRDQFSAQNKTKGTFAKVVMLTNMVGKAGMSMGALYAAMKAGIVSLTKTMAKEFGRFANCNAVAMAPLSTRKMQGPKDRFKKQYPSPIVASDHSKMDIMPKHIVPLVTFLASDGAEAINGQIISVDGGLWLKLEQ